MSGLERELDRLFGLPLGEFTPARNELARRLKAAKDDDAAARVRALVKPSVAAWAINQLSREDPAAVRALLDAGDALGKAQRRLLQKGGSADAIRDATAKQREAVQLLTERARAVFERAGRTPTAAMLDRVARTLQAAALDEEGRRLLKAGRLTGELQPAGFAVIAGGPIAEQPPPARDELAERRRQREERRLQRRERQRKVRELEQAARAAERKAERAAEAADQARRDADYARAAADQAAARLAEDDDPAA